MTLINRINQLQLRAAAADDEEKVKSRAGEFTALRERLQGATANATSVAAGRQELQAAGITQDMHAKDLASVFAVVRDLINEVEGLTLEAKFDVAKVKGSTVAAHFKNSEKFVADEWQRHLPPTASGVEDELLAALEQGGIDVEAIRADIEGAKLTLLVLSARTLPEPGDALKLQQALSTLNSSKSRIAEVIDPAMASIVLRAQDGGVPFLELTPEVILALTKLGILERFRVVLK